MSIFCRCIFYQQLKLISLTARVNIIYYFIHNSHIHEYFMYSLPFNSSLVKRLASKHRFLVSLTESTYDSDAQQCLHCFIRPLAVSFFPQGPWAKRTRERARNSPAAWKRDAHLVTTQVVHHTHVTQFSLSLACSFGSSRKKRRERETACHGLLLWHVSKPMLLRYCSWHS